MPMQLLHLDSSILGEHSVSRQLSAAVVERFLAGAPDALVTYRDLAADPIPHLSGPTLLANGGPAVRQDAAMQTDLALGAAVLDEFLAADVIVIGVGFYNFGIPSQLKAWIDRIAVAGKTFRYTEHGPEGLATDKRVVLAMARGGYYGPDSPHARLEHAESYLRAVFAFTGVRRMEVVAAEGVKVSDDQRIKAITQARHSIAQLRPEEVA